MNINSISDFRTAIRNGAYAWPGGYPLYFIMADGEAVSFAATKDKWTRRQIIEALADNARGAYGDHSWFPVALEVNWENTELYCAVTNDRIESAYGDE